MFARISFSAVIAAGLAVPVHAAEPVSSAVIIVDQAALSSQKLLNSRIAAALEEVCGSYAAAFSWQVSEIDKCRAKARQSVSRQLTQILGAGDVRLSAR